MPFINNFSLYLRLTFCLLILACVTSFRSDFNEDSSTNIVFYSIIGSVLVSFIIRFFKKIPNWLIHLIPALVLSVPIGAKFLFSNFEVVYSITFYLLLLLGTLIFIVAYSLDKRKKNILFLRPEQVQELAFIAYSFLFFALYFFGGSFGVLLFSVLFFTMALNSTSSRMLSSATGFIVLSIATLYFQRYEQLEISFFNGAFWAGIICGVTLMNFILGSKNNVFTLVISLLIVLLFYCFGLKVQLFQPVLFVFGALLGSGISTLVRKDLFESQLNGLAFPIILALIFPFSLQFHESQKETIPQFTQKENSTTAEKLILSELPALILSEKQTGVWENDKEKSLIRFQLGPKGSKTDGAILRFVSNLEINKSGVPSKLTVKMEANSLTTLDQARDESVLGNGYINAGKFKDIVFTATDFSKIEDGYLAVGTLDFVGKKVDTQVKLKFSENEEFPNSLILTGSSEVNRTKHSMQSDSKIGDLVTISFEIILKK